MASTRTRFGDERQTVVRRMDLAQRDEDPLQCLGGCVSESKQIDVLRRSNRLTEPDEEECRTLQDEAVGELRLRKAVQQTLASESGQRELMLDVELVAPFDEPRLNRSDDVLGAAALHRTTVSR